VGAEEANLVGEHPLERLAVLHLEMAGGPGATDSVPDPGHDGCPARKSHPNTLRQLSGNVRLMK
jgi:hypothetical protein